MLKLTASAVPTGDQGCASDCCVIAVVDGDFTCKRLHQRGGTMRLKPENPAYPDIVPKDGQTVEIWGVVVATIHQHNA